jgi:hypothetical protein
VSIVGKLTVADEIEQQRSEEAFDKADSKLNRQFLMRRLEKERKAAEAERKKADAEKAAAKEAKERKADPLYDDRKAARAEAEKGATTKMVGGVKVTEYPAVDEVERRPTAQIRGGGGGGGAGSLLREMNPQKLYNKGGAVKSASSRADGIAQRGKTRGRVR